MQKGNSERKQILSVNEINKNIAGETENVKELMLFLSFDITDSTKLKLRYPKEWAKVIDILLSHKFQYMEVWKFNGDEVLYKRSINSLEFIVDITLNAYKFLNALQKEMQKHIKEISLKATMWLAVTEQNLNDYKYNYSFKFEDFYDFVGKSIDEGFRLSKCSSMQKIAIDPKIIYIFLDAYRILTEKTTRFSESKFFKSADDCDAGVILENLGNVLRNTHLVGYSKCKGVWGDNPYPIYWYYNSSAGNGIKYFDYLNGEHLWGKNPPPLFEERDKCARSYSNIQEVFEQVDIFPEIRQIYELMEIEGALEISSESKANLYFMVVCINPKTHKVLIARRSKTRKHLKNVWDFGNVKYQNIEMKKTIEKEYKNTFGIDIELITDSDRDDYIKPFAYCTIYRNCRPHNSILCYATIKNPENMTDEQLVEFINRKKTDKYSEVRFVEAADVEAFTKLSLDDIRIDSEKAEKGNNEPYNGDYCIMFFENSISGAIGEYLKHQQGVN